MSQTQGESLQECKVPTDLQWRIEEQELSPAPDGVENCTVAKTDWINSKLQNDGMPQTQGESLQNCKVPNNLQSRIK